MKKNGLTWNKAPLPGEYIIVDGACDHTTGVFEYKGIFYQSKDLFFKFGPVKGGSNNIAEFLAAVHALSLCKKRGLRLPVYTDSQTALAWVRNRRANTGVEMSGDVEMLIGRAEKWLRENPDHNDLRKWDTKNWGENPADFGNKR